MTPPVDAQPESSHAFGAPHNIDTSGESPPKIEALEHACSSKDHDRLRQLAVSAGGLVNNEVRRTAWPLLLGCGKETTSAEGRSGELPPHGDEGQVQLDVDRSFVYYPENESEEKLQRRRAELSHVIVTVLRRHRMLHYFQGYHDIVQVFLLVLGEDAAVDAVSRLSLLRIRDFMLPSMRGTESHLRLLPPILYAADPELASHLSHTQPFFALPATLTLYAHVIEEYGQISRLFDFLLATEAVMSIYLFAVVVISRKKELLEIDADEPEMLHSTLSKLPKPLDLDDLVQRAVNLFQQNPPEKLPNRAWSYVSSSSVLKTTRDLGNLANQSLSDGERWFEREADEIKRREASERRQQQLRALARRYQRTVAWIGTAILFAIVAMYARSNPTFSTTSAWGSMLDGVRQRLLEGLRSLAW